MTVAVLQRDMLMPRPPQGMGPGLMLALVVHGLLLVAIAFSVRWRASEPTGVTAELWASVPEFAAPRAEPPPQPQPVVKPEPPPPPPVAKAEPQPDAQIALEKAKREEAERRRKEEADKLAEKRRHDEELAEKRKKEEAEKLAEKRKEEQAQKLADDRRKKNIERMMAQAGATGEPTDTGQSTRTAGPPAGYAGRIAARIKPHINFPPDLVSGNPQAEVEIRLGPDGTILSSRLVKSSGSTAYDNAVLNAVTDTRVLPLDNGRNWSPITLSFRPRD
jgi:colicin import membrane protein